MGLLSNKIDRRQLNPGDHIFSWRQAYLYPHHGIYDGEGKVIHFTKGADQESGTGTILDRLIGSCGAYQARTDGVISSCLDCFLSGGDLYRFEYGVSCRFFLARVRGDTCTLASLHPAEEVLHRARFLLENGFDTYNVFTNNCIHFAIYCKTGLRVRTNISVCRGGKAASCVAGAVASLPLRLNWVG